MALEGKQKLRPILCPLFFSFKQIANRSRTLKIPRDFLPRKGTGQQHTKTPRKQHRRPKKKNLRENFETRDSHEFFSGTFFCGKKN